MEYVKHGGTAHDGLDVDRRCQRVSGQPSNRCVHVHILVVEARLGFLNISVFLTSDAQKDKAKALIMTFDLNGVVAMTWNTEAFFGLRTLDLSLTKSVSFI